MDFNEYQRAAIEHAVYPNKGQNLIYPALGLAGESGETVDKIKKYWRNHGATKLTDLTHEQRKALLAEIGDVLWYVSALSFELGCPLEIVAMDNIAKLNDRVARNVIKGEGDNR